MQAKLKTNLYDLAPNGVRQNNANDGANILGLILLNVESIDTLQSDATDCEKVEILDNGAVVQTYEDYTNFMSISADGETTEVMMCQPSLVKQVANLKAVIRQQEQVIAEQSVVIHKLTVSQKTQDEEILELQEVVVEL